MPHALRAGTAAQRVRLIAQRKPAGSEEPALPAMTPEPACRTPSYAVPRRTMADVETPRRSADIACSAINAASLYVFGLLPVHAGGSTAQLGHVITGARESPMDLPMRSPRNPGCESQATRNVGSQHRSGNLRSRAEPYGSEGWGWSPPSALMFPQADGPSPKRALDRTAGYDNEGESHRHPAAEMTGLAVAFGHRHSTGGWVGLLVAIVLVLISFGVRWQRRRNRR